MFYVNRNCKMHYITKKDYEKAVKKAISARDKEKGCRLAEKAYYAVLINELANMPYRTAGKGKYHICVESVNIGSSKWSDWVQETKKYNATDYVFDDESPNRFACTYNKSKYFASHRYICTVKED